MKKQVFFAVLLLVVASIFVAGCGSSAGKTGASGKGFQPDGTINWMCTSSPGGGSDIFSRQIADIMAKENLINGQSAVITNKTEGAGEVGRNDVATTKGKKADLQLLTFNSGDLMPMVKNTKNRAANFKIIAIMAVDKQLIFKGKGTKYSDFKQAIEAAKSGQTIVIGGSKGDDIATYEALIKELGLTKDQMNYITYNSTGDAITAQLGDHIDFVIAKPAAVSEYVTAGDLIPVLALSKERFGGDLKDAPRLSEIGAYQDVEVPIWRGIAGPAGMSDEAVVYWSDVMKKVSETDAWKNGYIKKYMLLDSFMDHTEATEYVASFEKDYLESIGEK